MATPYIYTADTSPTARLFFFNPTTGAGVTGLVHNTSGLTLVYARDNGANTAMTLVTATLGTWVSLGFVERGGGFYDLYLPVAASAAGAEMLQVIHTGTIANTLMAECIIPLTPDNLTVAGPTDATIASAVWAAVSRTLTSAGAGGGATAAEVWAHSTRTLTSSSAPTAAENAAAAAVAVEAALLDNFDALPTAAEIAAAVAAPSAGTIAAAVAAPSAAAIAAAVAAPSASAIASAVAAPSAGTIATTVRGALAPDFAAIPVPPTASQVSTQTVADLAGVPGLPARAAIADKLLLRNHEGGDDSGRSVSSTLAANRNRVERSGNTITVYRADDVTILYTAVITTDAALLPVSGINPA